MSNEIWLPIPGYEGRYEVSASGSVRGLRYPPRDDTDGHHSVHIKFGYPKVLLFKNSKVKWFFVHRLVWMTYRGPIPKGLVVNHIDHNKGNPCLENLELITQSENIKKAMKFHGVTAFLRRTA